MSSTIIHNEIIEQKIYPIRGQKIMLSNDLAVLYQVEPKVLTQAMKRNLDRFPSDFMFQLDEKEFNDLKSQFVTSSWGGVRRARPYAFTEQGVTMLSSVPRSGMAVQVSIAIVRVFVKLRQLLSSHAELSKRLDEIEKKYDSRFRVVFEAIRELMKLDPLSLKQKIGFRV